MFNIYGLQNKEEKEEKPIISSIEKPKPKPKKEVDKEKVQFF